MVIYCIIPLALLIWLNWYISKQFYEAAQAKGYNDRKYFWICFWLGIVGYLLVIALPNNGSIMAMSDELPDL